MADIQKAVNDTESRIITRTTSPWQEIEIRYHEKFGHQLVIDNDLQISESDRSYNVAMVSPLVIMGTFGRIAILGGGDGGVLYELLEIDRQQSRALEKAVMIDIDEEVMRLSQKYLPGLCGDAFDHPKAEVITGDVFDYMETLDQLDSVIYDLTIDPVREGQTRAEFLSGLMKKVAGSLKPGGMFNMQCCGTRPFDEETGVARDDIMRDIRNALNPHFSSFVEQRVFIPSFLEAWTFLAARKV
ncbi:hypothetical protein QA596_08625 [Balneolales bacterium ANBcel1]|nr:hypothetical protein [Balneolales bacterium ANBcel1]